MTIRLMKNTRNVLQERKRKSNMIYQTLKAHVMKSKNVIIEAMTTLKSIRRPEIEIVTGCLGRRGFRANNDCRSGSAVNTFRQICFSTSIFSPPDGKHFFVISPFVIELLSIRAVLVCFKVLSTANIVGIIIQHFFPFLPMFRLMQMIYHIWLYFGRFSSVLTKHISYEDTV